jgi:hypothetical protein
MNRWVPATDFLLRKTLGSKTACPHAKRKGRLANAHCQLVLSTTMPENCNFWDLVVFLGFCGLLLGFVGVCCFFLDLSVFMGF